MSMKKFIMKQYWRVGTIRALLSLAMGMLLLGRLLYVDIPYLQDMGIWGAIILGLLLVLLFMAIGWAYDEKGKMWAPDN
ncbi:MAG: hypothetical protein ACFFFK_00335, partial [Candidatus Thorarchaeota archaeon]